MELMMAKLDEQDGKMVKYDTFVEMKNDTDGWIL
jgi:hypothetical protein